MHALARFHPYLSGPVLKGIAGRYAEIDLQLFPESAKEVELFLLDDRSYRYPNRYPDTPEKTMALMGSRHKVKRKSVKIQNVKSLKAEEITDHVVKHLLGEKK